MLVDTAYIMSEVNSNIWEPSKQYIGLAMQICKAWLMDKHTSFDKSHIRMFMDMKDMFFFDHPKS